MPNPNPSPFLPSLLLPPPWSYNKQCERNESIVHRDHGLLSSPHYLFTCEVRCAPQGPEGSVSTDS
jgi:hypothetical protein